MPRIFGQELTGKQLWIGGGLIAAAVAVIVFLRARAGSVAQAPAAEQPADYGYGGGMSVSAPSQGVADSYTQSMQNADLEAASLANQYQKNLITQQEKQFQFQMSQEELLAPEYRKAEAARLAAEEHYNKTVAKTKIRCPKGQALAQAPDGSLTCYGKGSGIPILTDTLRAAEGVVYGAAQAAPSIGYDAAQKAAAYYTGKVFTTAPVKKTAKPGAPTMKASSSRQTLDQPTQRIGTGGYRSSYQDLP